MGLTLSPPHRAVSGACFPLPAVCSSGSGSESKSGRPRSCCRRDAQWAVGLGGAGEERDGGSSQGCWAVQSPTGMVQGFRVQALGEVKLFLRVTFKQDLWGGLWALLVSPPASMCSLSWMKTGSRSGALRDQLSTHGTPCFLNLLDTPTQEEPPAKAPWTECCYL